MPNCSHRVCSQDPFAISVAPNAIAYAEIQLPLLGAVTDPPLAHST